MKNPVFVLLFFTVSILSAQIPQGYYDAADGLSGEELKAALNNIIDGHTEYSYTSSSTDTWDILKEADRDPNNPDNVLCIYSGFSRSASLEYNNGAGWSREHVWAKSRGDFGTSRGAGTDAHHLRAADVSTNSARANRNFAYECDKQYVDGDGSTECYTCTEEYSWEPPDAVKGDIARMLFYMATRYEGENGEPDLELTETLLDKESNEPLHGVKSVLLLWHEEDPVSEAEQTRNDIVFSYQNNRNPFIDHPEYVNMIWGEVEEEEEEEEEETVLSTDQSVSGVTIYPNPATDSLIIDIPSGAQRMVIYDLGGKEYQSHSLRAGGVSTFDVSELAAGSYVLVIELAGKELKQKLVIED